jgi:hypothetical protein
MPMLDHLHSILKEYRNADFNRRLHLYLQFPPLRSEFMVIDRSDSPGALSKHTAGNRLSRAAQLSALPGWSIGRLKRLFGIVMP